MPILPLAGRGCNAAHAGARVPQCEREEVEALFRVQCEGAARVRQPRSSYASP